MSDAAKGAYALPSKRVIAVRLLVSLLPLAVFIWILKKIDLPLHPPREALNQVRPLAIVAYGVLFFAVLLIRGYRWRYLVRSISPVSSQTSLDLTSIGNAAIVLFPMRSGEVVRPLLAKRHGISPVAALSSIGAERIIDGLSVGLIVFVSLSLAPGHPQGLEILPPQFRDPGLVTKAARYALVGFSIALCGLLLFYFKQAFMQRLILGTLGRLSRGFAERLNQIIGKLASGLSFLKDHTAATIYLCLTVLFWGLQLEGLHLLLGACGFEGVRFIESCAINGVFALGFLLPSPPGFFGAFQTTLYAGLLLYFPTAEVVTKGACVVFFAYAIQLGETLLLGVFCYLRQYVIGSLTLPRSGV